MLTNHKLLLDNTCPMCTIYGNCFIRLAYVDKTTLSSYQHIEEEYSEHIDMELAQSKIALYDTESRSSLYGIDAILHIIEIKHKYIAQILRLPMIYWILEILYSFISYNRKIIVRPSLALNGRNCNPPLIHGYRWAYLVITALLTGLILKLYYSPIFMGLGWSINPWTEYIICFAQVIFQYISFRYFFKETPLHYLGHMSTVSMIGGTLLLPMLLLNSMITLPIFLLLGYFFVVVGIMLTEHIIRSTRLGLVWTMTLSWITFRTLILIILIVSL